MPRELSSEAVVSPYGGYRKNINSIVVGRVVVLLFWQTRLFAECARIREHANDSLGDGP